MASSMAVHSALASFPFFFLAFFAAIQLVSMGRANKGRCQTGILRQQRIAASSRHFLVGA
ncbi:hypothetical protein BV25DRAFT_1832852 [Artomyces pyxidatus]|uniref:Uncharacterized protein n=1 Tax=Artomyces pyxidatus TaxID=48021 RepID=A0ACB8SGW8_9AGAM|nr:hypothetical protein BV25DRAFT_1832852 [Artomyces pyxidatus]